MICISNHRNDAKKIIKNDDYKNKLVSSRTENRIKSFSYSIWIRLRLVFKTHHPVLHTVDIL